MQASLVIATFRFNFGKVRILSLCTNPEGLFLEEEVCLQTEASESVRAHTAMGMGAKELCIAGGLDKSRTAYRILTGSKIIQSPWP